MNQTVRKYFELCTRCGGAEAPEVTVGASVVMFLNTTANPEFPASVPAVVVNIEPGSLTDTIGRYYTFQYDDTDLPVALLSACDIVSVLCKSCCVLLQEQIDLIRGASLPDVSLTYDWLPVDNVLYGKVRLKAFAQPTLPSVTIVKYEFFRAADDLQIGTVDDTLSYLDLLNVPNSSAALYPGGVYYVRVTDSGGRIGIAATYVTLDDRLNELDVIRRAETSLASNDQVYRETLERGATDTNIYSGGTKNPAFWGRDLQMSGIGFANTAPNRPCVRISDNHLLYYSAAPPVLGAGFTFQDDDSVNHVVTVTDFREIGGGNGLYVVAFGENLAGVCDPIKFLPADFQDWITPQGAMPGAIISQAKKAGVIYFNQMTLSVFDYTRTAGFGDIDLVVGELGNPCFLFVDGQAVFVGFRFSAGNKLTYIGPDGQGIIEAAIEEIAVCPPFIHSHTSTVKFWNVVDWFNIRRRPQISTTPENVVAGFDAGAAMRSSAAFNVIYGANAGRNITTGRKNTITGHNAQPQAADNENSIVIGCDGQGNGSNTTVIGNNSTLAFYPRGNVSIGTLNSPLGRLHVQGTTARFYYGSTGLLFSHNGAARFVYAAENALGGFEWRTGADATEAHSLFFTKDGLLGIGTATPVGKLDVVGNSGTWVFAQTGTSLLCSGASCNIGNNHATGVTNIVAVASVTQTVNGLKITEAFANRDFKIFGHDGTVDYEWNFTMSGGIARINNNTVGGAMLYAGTNLFIRGDAIVQLSCGANSNITLAAALTQFNKPVTFIDTTIPMVITTGTTNGTQFGAAANNKLSFFGGAPVVQPVASANANVVAAGAGAAVLADTTFDGGAGGAAYSVGGVILRLKQLGLLA